ncbi:MAG: 50S ribosomal protein L4 [Deltaproteobacteria bacterium]|nr:MAG: 50S ribosomal protein L4 [Deltaproteobacteria bacterium]RTZ97828.1 MAG: 50S ribosomal protein L4 [Deltaproteobacteria bacterium]
MAVVDVLNNKAEKVDQIDLRDDIFNISVKPDILHQVVTMQLAGKRSGTASVKNRSDIKGSTRKLYRQKGTGRARRGNAKSPLLRGGGVVFGPHPKSWAHKVPKKVKALALKMALSSKLSEEQLLVLDGFGLERIKTRDFVKVMNTLDVQNALIVTDELDTNLDMSSRNLPGVKVLKVAGLNVYDILKYKHLLLLTSSVEGIERRLAA